MSKIIRVVLLILALGVSGCSSSFNPTSLTRDKEAKQSVLSLMDKANDSYASNESIIQQLTKELNGYKTSESKRSNNDETIKMWENMMSPDKNLYGGFIKKWKEKGSLSPGFINEYKPIITEAFDQIIELEEAKK